MNPKWKKAGPNGEVEVTIKGQRYKIEKALDHNERHKGEFKIMVWDKRREEWEWDNTVRGKAYAKELVMDKLDEATNMRNLKLVNKIKKSGVVKSGSMKKEAVEPHPEVVKAYKKTIDADDKDGMYGTTITKRVATRARNTLSKKIKQHHPGLDMKGKIALRTTLQYMKENKRINTKNEDVAAVNTGSIPNPATTVMGKRPKEINVTDRRRKKNKLPVLLKRFRKHMEENG